MDAPNDGSRRFTFGQLSGGLQVILILILLGSCSGGSDNAVTDNGVEDDVHDISRSTGGLSRQVRQLRREVRRLRIAVKQQR